MGVGHREEGDVHVAQLGGLHQGHVAVEALGIVHQVAGGIGGVTSSAYRLFRGPQLGEVLRALRQVAPLAIQLVLSVLEAEVRRLQLGALPGDGRCHGSVVARGAESGIREEGIPVPFSHPGVTAGALREE
jgi:hypothetical protein